MNSKSQISDYLIAFIPRILFLIIVLTAIYILVNSYIKVEVDTFDAESNLFIQRVLYSRNSISYLDKETGQLYPGIIDVAKLATIEEDLKKSMSYSDSRHLAARFVITNMLEEQVAVFYYNKDWFERWFPLIDMKGPGGVKSASKKLYMLLKDKSLVDVMLLEKKVNIDSSSPDAESQDNVQLLKTRLESLKAGAKDRSFVPAYLEVTVIIPNS